MIIDEDVGPEEGNFLGRWASSLSVVGTRQETHCGNNAAEQSGQKTQWTFTIRQNICSLYSEVYFGLLRELRKRATHSVEERVSEVARVRVGTVLSPKEAKRSTEAMLISTPVYTLSTPATCSS